MNKDKQTFVQWQVECLTNASSDFVDEMQRDWDESDIEGRWTAIVMLVMISMMLWACCGLAPAMALGIRLIIPTVLCVVLHIPPIIWVIRRWVRGRYNRYIESVGESDE